MPAFVRARAMHRGAVVAGGAAAGLLLLAVPALAHITVTPGSAAAGSAVVLTFHVPNEEAGAATIKLDMRIPTAHPIAQLLVKPVPGWRIAVRTVTLAKPVVTDDGRFTQAVSEVIWSGGRIAPGQFEDFTVSADPLPGGAGQLAFKAVQTYSDGHVVRWIDLPQPGQPAPDHPAPVLTLTTATAPVTASAASNASAAGAAGAAGAAASGGSGADGLARALGAAGLALGLVALAVAGLGVRRRRGSRGRGSGPT